MKTIPHLLALASMLCMKQRAFAEIPAAINYQGRLTSAAGVPQPGGKTMSLKILDSSTGGSLLYSENLGSVILDANGVYGFQFGAIGAGTPPNLAVALAASTEQWLELTVNGEPQAPRQKILAVPYAIMAGALPDGAVSPAMIANGAVTLEKLSPSVADSIASSMAPPSATEITTALGYTPVNAASLGTAATADIKIIRRIVALGTSITNNTSLSTAGSRLITTQTAGFPVVAQTRLEHRFTLARRSTSSQNPNILKVAYGYDGFTSERLLNGYNGDYPMALAIETQADAIIIEAGANDTLLGASGMANAIIALWDRAIPNFEKVFALNVLPQGPANGDRRAVTTGCNALLVSAAASRPKVVLVDAYSAVEKDVNGYATTTHMNTDLIHPNGAGGYAIGIALAEAMRPYIHGPKYAIPENGSSQWVTTNQLKTGTASLPTGWTASQTGTDFTYAAVDESSVGGYRWQRFGATPPGGYTPYQPYQLITAQTEAVYGNAVNTNAGTATITITAAVIGTVPLVVPFTVTAGQSATDWTAAARAALAANSEVLRNFEVGAYNGLISLTVAIPERTDPTFRIAIQLPGVGSTVGWQRWFTEPYSLGGWRVGDRVRACARFRINSGNVIAIAPALRIYNAPNTLTASALGFIASNSAQIPGTPGLYLTEAFEIPPNTILLHLLLQVCGSGPCVIDARDVGIFRELD